MWVEVMRVKQQEGSFSLLNAGLSTAETDYTTFQEMEIKKTQEEGMKYK